jgi:hypothetical protein
MVDTSILERLAAYGFGEDVVLPIDSIEVPEEFQRELKPRNWGVFAPPLFGRPSVAEVTKAGGKKLAEPRLLGVDGQHRIHEAKIQGYTEVPCVLVKDMTLEDAAGWFDIANHARVGLPQQVEFRAACMSLNANALALDKALLARGLDAWPYTLRTPHSLKAVTSVRVLQTELGLEHTLYTLDVLSDIWPWVEKEGLPEGLATVPTSPHARAIRGFGQFLRPEKKVQKGARTKVTAMRRWNPQDRDLLVGFLREHHGGEYGLDNLIARAENSRRGGGGGSLGMEITLASVLRRARKEANETAAETAAA